VLFALVYQAIRVRDYSVQMQDAYVSSVRRFILVLGTTVVQTWLARR
jgi:hypothetical protein